MDEREDGRGNGKPASTETREQRRARKREEARLRAEHNRKVAPLQRKVSQLEAEIEGLEDTQRKRNLELADPGVYEDPGRRDALLAEYQRDAKRLAELTEAWELAQEELEG